VRPLANGTSQPSAEQTLVNLRSAGFEVPLNEEALAEMSAYFAALARRIGRTTGVPAEYDASIYRHQLPGGMTSTLRRQLREVGQEGRWDEVLEEIPRVREELGWPIMVTPLSQFVGVQAFLNVTTGARYSQIPDEVVKYVLGQYGPPPGELDPGVAAAVRASPRAEQFANERSSLDLGEARARYGDAIGDELLLLRMMLPAEQVDAMLAGRGRSAPGPHPVVALVEGLTQRPVREIELTAPGLRVRAR
jgi:oxaloacetate decarboxylase alpha subunit